MTHSLTELQRRAAAAREMAAKAPPLEKEIERLVCKFAKERGCWVTKFKSENHRGVPDDIFITPRGSVFFIEFKRPGLSATALQSSVIEEMRANKANVYIVDNVSQGRAVVENEVTWG